MSYDFIDTAAAATLAPTIVDTSALAMNAALTPENGEVLSVAPVEAGTGAALSETAYPDLLSIDLGDEALSQLSAQSAPGGEVDPGVLLPSEQVYSDVSVTTHRYRDEGGSTVTEYYHDGFFAGASYAYSNGSGSWFTTDGKSGSWSASTSYWSVGASLGLGFGLWGTGTGNWGIAWNAGIGAYAIFGESNSPGAAIQEVTQDDITIGIDLDGVPTIVSINPQTGDVTHENIVVKFGAYATDPEGPYGEHPSHSRLSHV